MSSLPVNQNFALSDVSIAIAQDGPNTHSMIYIYPIITEDCKETEKKEEDDSTKKDQKKEDIYFKTDDPALIKKLRYSGEPMDVVYSSRFMSMSKDGRYLAISWLPNPRLGSNISMKYSVVYDLNNLDSLSNGNTDDNKIKVEIPCNIFEFTGGCTFTNDGKFVLINDTKALVYSIQNSSTFDLDFTVRISPTITSALDEKDGKPIFDFYPSFLVPDDVLEKEIISKLKSSSIRNTVTAASGVDNYDDIFFDDSGDEFISDLDDEDSKEIHELSNEEGDDTMTGESAPQYQAFLKNDRFIRNNIKNVKDIGVICLISPSLDSNSNGSETEAFSLFVWGLVEKRLVFVKKLKQGEYESNLRYATVFTKQRNLVALSKKYDSLNTTHQSLGTNENSISILYDCSSGVTVAKFCLPKEREIFSISEILFLQNDTYFLAVSHSRGEIFYDIWDVLSATHLDTFVSKSDEKQLCLDYSRFILRDNLPLKFGCGVYLQVEYQRSKDLLNTTTNGSMISIDNFNLSIQKVRFFNQENARTFVRGCRCGKTTFYTIQGSVVRPKDVRYSKAYTLNSMKDSVSLDCKDEILFFLDADHTHMMSCQWDPSTTGVDILMMTVWEISGSDSKELRCESHSENHELDITFKALKYKLILNRNDYIRSQTGLIGHPTMFLDMKAVREYCIKQVSPIILYTDVAGKTPVLLFETNRLSSGKKVHKKTAQRKLRLRYAKLRKDFTRGFFLEKDEQLLTRENMEFASKEDSQMGDYYDVAIPLHPYSGLESHLHALASQNMISIVDKRGVQMKDFHYNDYVNINYGSNPSIDVLLDSPELLPTKEKVIELIHSSSEYFSTLAGYATICRLAVHRDHYEVLSEILKESTKINYCILATHNNNRSIDPLQEALKNGAVDNARLIVKHLKHSMATYGAEYGQLLTKHRQLLIDKDIQVDL